MNNSHNEREQNIFVAAALNTGFAILELIGGILTNSLAILSDALHDFGDSVALIISWTAERKASQPPDEKRTFGYNRLSLFSALFVAVILGAGSVIILVNAVPRLFAPEHVNASGMMVLAGIGILFNGIGYFRVRGGRSMNELVISWHLLEDVLGWVVILVGGVTIQFWDVHLVDPIITIAFTLYILWGVGSNLQETLNIFLQGVPEDVNLGAIESSLESVEGVQRVHDMHVWSLDGEKNILTAHAVLDDESITNPDESRERIKNVIKEHKINHSTIELESEAYCSGQECEDGL